MSKDKPTIRDVAAACNVSIATISYVLNNSEKEHISHETRMLVLETARKMNYIPCTVKNARKKNNQLIGIINNQSLSDPYSKKFIRQDLVAELQYELLLKGYDTMVSNSQITKNSRNIIGKQSLDAVFVIDIDTTFIQSLTKSFYVPIIFLNCEINDSLFCSIYPNYPLAIAQANRLLSSNLSYIVMEPLVNQELAKQLTSSFQADCIYINNKEQNLSDFLAIHRNEKGIILGDLLGMQSQQYISMEDSVIVSYLKDTTFLKPHTNVISMRNETLAKTAVNVMERQFHLEYNICPNNKMILNPDEFIQPAK